MLEGFRLSGPSAAFQVSDVAVSTERLPLGRMKQAVENTVGGSVEACSHYTGKAWGAQGNLLIHAARWAFDLHFPLVLSPDMLWLTILQGVAIHVAQHAERLRSRLVRHEGTATIEVEFDDFVKGSPENPWEQAFSALSVGVQEYLVEGVYDRLIQRFSTTGPVEHAAFEVALLDVMQSFFKYVVLTRCGIPSVTLEGEVADWERLEQAVRGLRGFDLDWWIDDLEEILPQFVQARQGQVDPVFWQSLYNLDNGSGGPHLSGWLAHFVPYIVKSQGYVRNPLIAPPKMSKPGMEKYRWHAMFSSVKPSDMPTSVSSAPFLWQYHGTDIQMQMLSGLLAIEQDATTRAVRPRIGWAVRKEPGSG